jgi:DNA-binding NtrC family response regulator
LRTRFSRREIDAEAANTQALGPFLRRSLDRPPFCEGANMARVLIVDDERACRESAELLLSLEGFEVRTAATSQEGIELGNSYAPDVLVVDWMLASPVDGLQVLEALRRIHPTMQAVVITGYLSAELEAQIKALPGTQYLAKPFLSGELVAAVSKAARVAD